MLHKTSLIGLLAQASFIWSANAADAATYTDYSVKAIERLNAEWYSVETGIWNDAWWNSGNALTTLADFTLLRLDEANKLNLGGYMRNTFEAAQRVNVQSAKSFNTFGMVSSTYCLNSQNGCKSKRDFLGKRGFDNFINEFYDDEGWWALAWIRCHDAAGDQDFLEMAVDIFNDMQTGGGTPCGGIYWNKERKYVSSISNELYLSVAASLARRKADNSTYLDIAKKQWEWFEKSGLINDEGLINDGLDSNCKNNGQQTWSYNQGVILGGLVELALATGDGNYLNKATDIAKAAIKKLANDDGILEEADKCELKEGSCGNDGKQFKGIFVRNLRYLHSIAPQDEFKSFILKNADSIWKNNRGDGDKLGVAWQGPFKDSIGPSHSSALDVLVAAVAVA